MKRFKFIAATAAVLTFASSSFADVTLYFTGSTAFRAAAHSAMRDMLTFGTGQGYAYTGTSGLNGANQAIFKGTIAGQPTLGVVTINCAWGGSTGGIQTLTSNAAITFLNSTSTPLSSSPGAGVAASNVNESAVPNCTMMDTQQATTPFQSPELTEQVVGVLPFVFVAGRGAPAGITNMTAQLARQLYTGGFLSASAWTGNPADAPVTMDPVTGDITTNAAGTTVYAAGRNNESGTRTLALTETGIGGNSRVVQLFSQASLRATPRSGTPTILDVLAADRSSLSLNMIGKPITGTNIPGSTTVSGVTASTITISAASTAPGTQIDVAIGQALSTGASTGVYYTRDTGNGGQSSGGTLADQLRIDLSNITDAFSNQTNNSYSPKGCFIGYLGLSDADRAVNGTGTSVGTAGARYLSYEGVSCMGGVAASITVASQGANTTTLTVPAGSTTGIIAGQLMAGSGITPGTTVVSTTSTTIVLSAPTSNGTALTNNAVKVTQFLPAAVRNGTYSFWAYQRLGYRNLTADQTDVKDAFFNQLTGSSTDLGAVSGIPDDFTMQFQRSIDGGQISSKF